jgi:hypothetical protein
MRFSIGNLPVLASHGIFFLLGMLFNGASDELPSAEVPSYKASEALLAFKKNMLDLPARGSLKAGIPVALIRISTHSQKPQCRYPPDFAVLKQAEPFPVVALSVSKLLSWREFFEGKTRVNYRLLALSEAAALPLCRETPKVSYGTIF